MLNSLPNSIPQSQNKKLIQFSPNSAYFFFSFFSIKSNKFIRQNNYTFCIEIIINQFNIINTERMNSQAGQIKIQQPSPEFLHIMPKLEETRQDRQGNSHIFAKTGHWNDHEKLRYLLFIDYHRDKLAIKQKRWPRKVFKAMASFIRSRKPNQCRTHHHKMQTYFESTSAIISYFKHRIDNYEQQFQRNADELSQLAFGFATAQTHDLFLEESISNNDSVDPFPKIKKMNRRRSSNTSINLAEEEHQHEIQEKDLPKTDNSVKSLPQDGSEMGGNRRHDFDFGQLQNEPFSYHYPFHFFPSNFPYFSMGSNRPLQPFSHGQQVNFFQIYRSRAQSQSQVREWMECEELYLKWRSSIQSLIHSNL